MIEIAVTTHFFQRRFCWMLSSILQQDKPHLDIIVNSAYVENTGDPTTKDVLDFFEGQGLVIKHTSYPNHKILQFRGLVRNRQLRETEANWMLFADTDVVYPLDYFKLLTELLEGRFKNDGRCLFSGRYSTNLEETEHLVDAMPYPQVIPDAFNQANKLPSVKRSNIGAGFCQIASVRAIRDKLGGLYVKPEKCKDWSWDQRFQKAKSDQQFRRAMGKAKLPLPRQIHLQHIRDNEVGHHVEIQR